MLVWRNFGPMRESIPIAFAICPISASVFSQRAEIELIEDIRWASIALATSFASSLDQTLVSRILSSGTQCA